MHFPKVSAGPIISPRSLLFLLLAGASVAEVASEPQVPPQSATPSEASTIAAKPTVGIDWSNPPRIGHYYYPGEARRKKQEGTCIVRIMVEPDGTVPAVQLVASSGFPLLDVACVNAFLGIKVRPASVEGKLILFWVNAPITWALGKKPVAEKKDLFKTPHLDEYYQLKIGPDYYPPTALQAHQHGVCQVHFFVDENGVPSQFSVISSTGYATLDQACVDAIQYARFVPGKVNDKAISAWTDIAMDWQLAPL